MFSWSEFFHNLLSDLIAKSSCEVFCVQPLVRLSCFEEAHFFSSQTKTRCLPIISTPAHWRSFMLHNFGSWFARIEPTTFFSVAKSLSLHFLLATPRSPTLSAFFPSFLILTFLPKACRRPPSLSLTLHPACLFTFSALFFFLFSHLQFPFYLSFLATVSHTPPRAFTLSTYIYIFSFLLSVLPVLSSPPLFSLTALPHLTLCAAAGYPTCTASLSSLSGCCPHCHRRRWTDLSGIARWSTTCHSEDAMWGSHCDKVCVCMYVKENKLLIHSRHVSCV